MNDRGQGKSRQQNAEILTRQKGFTLVELITVIVIVSVLAVTARNMFGHSRSQELSTSRDLIVAAMFTAQQLAMSQTREVEVVLGGNRVDILLSDTSVAFAGVQYPIDLRPGQTVSNHTLEFDRLGRTTATDITLNQGAAASVTIEVSSSGFSQ